MRQSLSIRRVSLRYKLLAVMAREWRLCASVSCTQKAKRGVSRTVSQSSVAFVSRSISKRGIEMNAPYRNDNKWRRYEDIRQLRRKKCL